MNKHGVMHAQANTFHSEREHSLPIHWCMVEAAAASEITFVLPLASIQTKRQEHSAHKAKNHRRIYTLYSLQIAFKIEPVRPRYTQQPLE